MKKLCVPPVVHNIYNTNGSKIYYSNHLLVLYQFRASSTIKLNYIHITLQFLSQLY